MSHFNSAKKNKPQKQPKGYYEQYLYNAHEPTDYLPSYTSAELEVKLLENSLAMKRRFRRTIAQRLRNRYQ